MGVLKNVLAHAAWSALFASGLAGAVSPVSAQQADTAARYAGSASSEANGAKPNSGVNPDSADSASLPDSPGTVLAQSQAAALPQASPPASASAQDSTSQIQPSPSQPNSGQQNASPAQKPVGTAAAEAPSTSGVAASEPAGAAIAPAKQHRARTIIIRTGAIVGAAVAVGAVVALTEATGSKPPGAH